MTSCTRRRSRRAKGEGRRAKCETTTRSSRSCAQLREARRLHRRPHKTEGAVGHPSIGIVEMHAKRDHRAGTAWFDAAQDRMVNAFHNQCGAVNPKIAFLERKH